MRSLEDQRVLLEEWLERHVNLPVEITAVEGKASGENLERARNA